LAERCDGEVQMMQFGSVGKLKAYLKGNVAAAEVAFEACSVGWSLAKWLKQQGHVPVMVDTTRVAEIGIGRHGRKTDEIDVERILVAHEQNRLPKAHIASDESQQLRHQLSIRAHLVESRAALKTLVKQMIRAQGEVFDRSYRAERMETVVDEAKLSATTRQLLAPLLATAKTLSEQIALVEAKIDQLCAKQPVIQRLCTVPGVGAVVAAMFVAVVDKHERFRTAHQLQSYLGLVPREYSSGGKQHFGAISKAGNRYLRSLLVQAAWTSAMRTNGDDPLAHWAQNLIKRRGKMVAAVAVARRIAGILWALWKNGTIYEPLRLRAESYRVERIAPPTQAQRDKAMKHVRRKLRKTGSWDKLMAA
jgi:transposase